MVISRTIVDRRKIMIKLFIKAIKSNEPLVSISAMFFVGAIITLLSVLIVNIWSLIK